MTSLPLLESLLLVSVEVLHVEACMLGVLTYTNRRFLWEVGQTGPLATTLLICSVVWYDSPGYVVFDQKPGSCRQGGGLR